MRVLGVDPFLEDAQVLLRVEVVALLGPPSHHLLPSWTRPDDDVRFRSLHDQLITCSPQGPAGDLRARHRLEAGGDGPSFASVGAAAV